MYVVINAHHEDNIKDNGDAQMLARIWQDASEIFADRDHRLLFEILNEPHLGNKEAMDPGTFRFMTVQAKELGLFSLISVRMSIAFLF